ncbi:hypothetical protein JL720_2804 [Aureococcus anophagefferens]|nr:hypothetical protein JL720_2804 [Aureococcus anophagefferens]
MTAKSAPAAPPAAAPGAGEQSVEELTELYAGMEFKTFAEENFQLCRKGMFKTKTDLDKVTRWKNELMKLALLNFKDGELQAEALQTNRNVLGFMGDRKSGKDTIDHCTKIMHNMLQSPEELRNEAYCQIMKQTTENPSGESTEDGDVKVADVAAFCLKKVPQICKLGARRELPTPVEIESTMRMDKAWIAGLLGVADGAPFSVFEVSTEDEERVLDADERVLDLVAYWDRLEREAREKKGKKSEVEEFHFAYKVRHFFDVKDGDDAAVELIYVQAKHDVRQEARLSYLDYVKSWKIYGSSYYFAEPKQNRDFPSEVVLAINAKGILVVDPDTKEFLQEYPYSQTKVYFKTEQGKEMNVMVRAYVEALMA